MNTEGLRATSVNGAESSLFSSQQGQSCLVTYLLCFRSVPLRLPSFLHPSLPLFQSQPLGWNSHTCACACVCVCVRVCVCHSLPPPSPGPHRRPNKALMLLPLLLSSTQELYRWAEPQEGGWGVKGGGAGVPPRRGTDVTAAAFRRSVESASTKACQCLHEPPCFRDLNKIT